MTTLNDSTNVRYIDRRLWPAWASLSAWQVVSLYVFAFALQGWSQDHCILWLARRPHDGGQPYLSQSCQVIAPTRRRWSRGGDVSVVLSVHHYYTRHTSNPCSYFGSYKPFKLRSHGQSPLTTKVKRSENKRKQYYDSNLGVSVLAESGSLLPSYVSSQYR